MLRFKWFMAGSVLALAVGCATPSRMDMARPAVLPQHQPPASGLVQAQATTTTAAVGDVNSLVQTALAANPRLGRANSLVESAQGRMIQAGLGPNPVFSFAADELGDRTGPMGLLSPQLSQEFVLGRKLSLGQAVAAREVDQAMLNTLSERYAIAGSVRAGAYDLAILKRRRDTLGEVLKLAKGSVEQATKAEKNAAGPLAGV
jgi:outer membrane protein, heavy metal efflux system